MLTTSHFLMTAALYRIAKRRNPDAQINAPALLVGSFMPDVALGLLTVAYIVQRRAAYPDGRLFGAEFDTLYFTDPWWIAGHNALHAPIMVALLVAVGYGFGVVRGMGWGRALMWFGIGCAFHSFVDILTHHNDGPLLFFPFDWQTRFASPVSYWDRDYGAAWFAPLEMLLNVVLFVWLAVGMWQGRRSARPV